MGQTLVTQATVVAAIVKQIKDGVLISSKEVTSELKDIPAVEINYRQLQTIIKVYRLENYTNTNVAGKGITTEVLRRELSKAIANQIAGTKVVQPTKKRKATNKKKAAETQYVYLVKALRIQDQKDYYWNKKEMVSARQKAFFFKTHQQALNEIKKAKLVGSTDLENVRVSRLKKK